MQAITADNGSRQPMFLAVLGVLLLLSITTVVARLYCRIVYVQYVGVDDYFILVAMIVVIAMSIANVIHISWGTGRHFSDLGMEALEPTLKHWYAYQLIYPFALFFVKASILALYHRLFRKRQFRYWLWVVAGIVTVYTVVVVFVNAFECRSHPTHAWSLNFPEGCNNLSASYFSMASISIATDVAILVLPLPVLVKLNIQRNKRLALIGIFLSGTVAVIASIVRLNALYIYTVTKDVSFDAIYILLWSQIEVNVAIITASAPSLRPMFRETFKSSHGSSRPRLHSGSQSAGYMFSRSRTRRSGGDGVIELHSYDGNEGRFETTIRGRAGNESEECILGMTAAGINIIKTVDVQETSVEPHEGDSNEDVGRGT
ncbi:uncharacterized protein K452DRAFT_314489 [Aplosporella prunicola CBS 121167]|uniref:Rhodopsin domain-containing protein n=1 Tax=Aplosporella prunicola CBS 121167 TaxID=1176127 RepID=A0A6A6BU04_9PEZI|nr:uncharacterized protein K452DRAFT_314489 [Aplosporella prunicola CBS 121167]KAF2147298.1 hypothetical protein K452DRAFT_314489 [Aplosporella prunicola CBS 121167]